MADVTGTDPAAVLREMFLAISEWWRLRFPAAAVVFAIFLGLGKFMGWLTTKVLMYRVASGFRSGRHFLETPEMNQLKTWEKFVAVRGGETDKQRGIPEQPKTTWARKWMGGVSLFSDQIGDKSTSFAALLIKWTLWSGHLSEDGAIIAGRLVAIVCYIIGTLLSLSYAGLSLPPLLATGGLAALAVSIGLRDVLTNFFCGCVLMVRSGRRPVFSGCSHPPAPAV